MVDNFALIREHLEFYNENTFYFLQLIKRRKENPDMESNSQVIHSYYIYSKEDLDALEAQIKKTCKDENCRAYINLNDLDLEKVSLNALCETARLIKDKEYKKIIKVWSAACGMTKGSVKKKWLFDLDGEQALPENKQKMIDLINAQEPNVEENKIVMEVPTKNGIHLITRTFNIKEFSKVYNFAELCHKDNPTILFIP